MTDDTGISTGPADDDVEAEVDLSPEAAELAAFDLDGDGKISLIEAERARLGVVDARLAELSEAGGFKGALAEAAHKVLDKLDNDG